MGACMSDEEFVSVQIMAPPVPIAAIDAKYVSLAPMRLNIKHNDWNFTGDYCIKDILTGIPYFQVDGSFFTMVDRKTLKDINGVNVATVETVPFSFGRREVYTCDDNGYSAKHIFSMEVTNLFGSTEMNASIVDRVTGVTHYLSCRGSVGSWNLIFYVDGNPIAKTTCQWEIDGDRFFVDIAPGVDIALIVLICVAVQEASE
ncbi:hypothetical protein THRCLA_11569 [Thraustotheca clavata]|uniref:Tubby C-terminal domain-containing protein n=1 Tax=Thraustotheca clavata TaxID=74557 RepID=A0A1V9Y7A4_9STRA|nr:hypothetical protein THRCLA_11569 [Thraustotheca clavata]